MKLEVIKEKERSVFEFSAPAKLSDLLALHEVPVRMPCGGRRSCLKCKIKVHGELSPMGTWESELLTEKEKAEGIRFACMVQAPVSYTHLAVYADRCLNRGHFCLRVPEENPCKSQAFAGAFLWIVFRFWRVTPD